MGRERSLFYVACSRARDELIVTWAGPPSPFLGAVRQPWRRPCRAVINVQLSPLIRAPPPRSEVVPVETVDVLGENQSHEVDTHIADSRRMQQVKEILGEAKTVRELLDGAKYSIDYYQREYKWQTKQIARAARRPDRQVPRGATSPPRAVRWRDYPTTSSARSSSARRTASSFIIDGQQRLTTLTLLLISCTTSNRIARATRSTIDELIFSEKFGREVVQPRCRRAHPAAWRRSTRGERIRRVGPLRVGAQHRRAVSRTSRSSSPTSCATTALPYFVDWLIGERAPRRDHRLLRRRRLHDLRDDERPRALAHARRTCSRATCSPTSTTRRSATQANELWKERDRRAQRRSARKRTPDCFKAWLRSQYADEDPRAQDGAQARGLRPHRHRVPPLGARRTQTAVGLRAERRLLPLHRPRLRLLQPPVPAAHRGVARRSRRAGARPLQRPARIHAAVPAAARAADARRR